MRSARAAVLPLVLLAASAGAEDPIEGRSQRGPVEEIPAESGPCEMCDVHSEAKQDRRILTSEGQLWLEFCSEECARTFYSNRNWRRYQKKSSGN